jgi:hypothetical protein
MYKPFIAILLFLFIFSCAGKRKATIDDYILGNWVEVKIISVKKDAVNPKYYHHVKQGLTFNDDKTYESKYGYFRLDTTIKDDVFLGNSGKYKVTGDSLLLSGPDNDIPEKFKILTLNGDSLKLDQDSIVTTFKHYTIKNNNAPAFDKIILSTTVCFGTCPATNVMISADGTVLFDGEAYSRVKGYHQGKISIAAYERLMNNFRQLDFDSLGTEYHSGWTDQQTIYVTFVKDNKIYKSVLDYGQDAPYLFEWACIPLQNLYQTIPLHKLPKPDSIPELEILSPYNNKNDSIIRLKGSEQFLLSCYLRNGKIVGNGLFKPRFKIKSLYDKTITKTDGRYYSFTLDGKEKTIDIGFNFFDVNSKNWKWEKPDEYGY